MSDQLEQHIAEINAKLDRIIRLLALNAVSADQSLKEKAVVLSSVGLAPREIAELLGTTRNAVSVALSLARHSKKAKTKGKAKKANRS